MSKASTLDDLLARSAASHPERTAVIDRTESLSYRELDQASARLAERLAAHGAGPGHRVGLYLDKSLAAIVAVWGVLRTGAAYVPLDVASPLKRIARITETSDLCGIVSTPKRWAALAPVVAPAAPSPSRGPAFVAVAPEPTPGGVEFAFEKLRTSGSPGSVATALRDSDEAAYVLYTSGSTGQPKGVVLSHRAALSFVDWAATVTELRSTDVVSSHAPLHFDLSVFDLFATCRAGACVVLVPPELNVFPRNLADWIAARQISVWYSVPSLLARLALSGALERHDWPHLRQIIFAGEVFPVAQLRALRALIPHARYWNWYGPTETNVCTAYAVDVLPPDQTSPVPIGTACANSILRVLDDNGVACARGKTGELYVTGPSVMTGYQAMPEATAQALVAGSKLPGGARRATDQANGEMRWYRTGDLVREDAEGQLHLLGRRDGMIKSRGYRIELGEIESTLHQHPAVAEAAVVALPDEESGHLIRAAAVAKAGHSLDATALRAFCADRLPAYMIPQSIAVCSSLPRGSTGKIDRVRLREDLASG